MSNDSLISNVLGIRHYAHRLHLARFAFSGHSRALPDQIDPATIEQQYAPNLRRHLKQLISGELPFQETKSVTIETLRGIQDGFDVMLQKVREVTQHTERFKAIDCFYTSLLQYLNQYEGEVDNSGESARDLAKQIFPESKPTRRKPSKKMRK